MKTECECCGFNRPVGGVKRYDPPSGKEQAGPRWFCQLCAGTHASQTVWYAHLAHESHFLVAVAYVGNQVRRDIATLQELAT